MPDMVEIMETVTTRMMVFEIDVVDQSENDTVCCTLSEITPGSLNFELVFENDCKL